MEIPTLQLIASVLTAVASVIVAIVSLRFTYRQNYGWRPIVLVTSHGLSGVGGEQNRHLAVLKFEIWNRRKYPIVVRAIYIHFRDLVIQDDRPGDSRLDLSSGWRVHRERTAFQSEPFSIEPTTHKAFELRAPFQTKSLDDIDEPVVINVRYFDPISNKYQDVRMTHHFSLK
jgi:hypothetical protein